MPHNNSQIEAALVSDTAWFRVAGKPSPQQSAQFKLALDNVLPRGVASVHVDLSRCPSVDSTFIGVLLFAWKRLQQRKPEPGRVWLANTCDLIRHQIDSLGVSGNFCLVQEATQPDGTFTAMPAGGVKADVTRTCLEAHRLLIETCATNEVKFKDVVRLLEEDLRAATPAAPGER